MPCKWLHVCSQNTTLEVLASGMSGFFFESAIVAIEKKHGAKFDEYRGIKIKVAGAYDIDQYFTLGTVNTTKGYGDIDHATQYGAYGMACLAIEKFTEYTVVDSVRKGEGVDFYLSKKVNALNAYNDEVNFLSLNPEPQYDARLEVSGTQIKSETKRRLSTKITQSEKSDAQGTPCFVAIMDFASPKLLLEFRDLDS